MRYFALKVTVVFAILLAGLALWQVRSIVALFILSLALAGTTRAPIAFFMQRGMPRWVAMFIVYGIGIGGTLILLYLLSYPLASEFATIAERVMAAYTRLQAGWHNDTAVGRFLAERLPTQEQIVALFTGEEGAVVTQSLFDALRNLGGMAGQIALAVVLSMYWTVDQARFERLWLSLLPSGQRSRARNVWRTMEAQVGAYIRSEIAQSLLAGALLTPIFWLLGMDFPVFWALIVSLAWFIPLVGWLIAVIPLWLMVWVEAGPVMASAAVAATFAVLVFLEFVIERRLYRQTRYNKVIVTLVMLAMVDLYGLLGLLLAPPLATAIEILFSELLEVAPKTATRARSKIDVAALRARLAETRQRVESIDEPSALRLSNMAARLDSLLKQVENL